VPFVRPTAGRRAAPTAADEASNTDAPTSKSRRVILAAIGLSLFSVTLLHGQAAAQDSANKLREAGPKSRARKPVAAAQRNLLNFVAADARIDCRQTLHTNACCSRECAGESCENHRPRAAKA
jgi:hypothetical protein